VKLPRLTVTEMAVILIILAIAGLATVATFLAWPL
jgi:cytochrome P450